MRRIIVKKVTVRIPEMFYNQIENFRQEFNKQNKTIVGRDIDWGEASSFISKRIGVPKIPNLLKNEKHKKKSRPY